MPAGSTYTFITQHTVSSDTSEVDFSSISQSYTDLVIVKAGLQNSAANLGLQIGNGSVDTNSIYSGTQLFGLGSGSGNSDRYTNNNQFVLNYSNSSTVPVISIYNIMNYSNTSTYKTIIGRNNDASYYTSAYVHLFRSTVAINTLKFRCFTNGIKAGTTFTLYGIAKA